jgi:tripartite-type tricarboxylate transporter receptor subunit TctC
MPFSRRHVLALAAALAATSGPSAIAQAWPAKPITIIVAYPAGGDTDAMARVFAEKLGTRLGQPVLVDNKPGASGIIGSTYVARSAPDGYTLLLAPNTFAFAQSVLKTSPSTSYDVVNSFVPVVQTCTMPMFIAVSGTTGLKDLGGLVAQAKSKEVSFATPGSGSPMHILGELFAKDSGAKLVHVPYKGVAPAVNDMLGGHVPMTVITLGPIAPFLGNGKIAALAVMDSKRSALAPQVPTMVEAGFKPLDGTAWQGVFAPKGTPAAVVQTLNQHLNEILKMPDVAAKMATFGALPAGGEPARLERTNADDHARYTKLVKDFGIQSD